MDFLNSTKLPCIPLPTWLKPKKNAVVRSKQKSYHSRTYILKEGEEQLIKFKCISHRVHLKVTELWEIYKTPSLWTAVLKINSLAHFFLWEVAEPRKITFKILVLLVAYQKSWSLWHTSQNSRKFGAGDT